jgi:hypothetical protein
MINLFKISLIAASLAVYFVQSAIDRRTGPSHADQGDSSFLSSGQIVIKKLSLGYGGLLADIYWMRAVQYYGGKRLKDEVRVCLVGTFD